MALKRSQRRDHSDTSSRSDTPAAALPASLRGRFRYSRTAASSSPASRPCPLASTRYQTSPAP